MIFNNEAVDRTSTLCSEHLYKWVGHYIFTQNFKTLGFITLSCIKYSTSIFLSNERLNSPHTCYKWVIHFFMLPLEQKFFFFRTLSSSLLLLNRTFCLTTLSEKLPMQKVDRTLCRTIADFTQNIRGSDKY
jgi:hypothetical protein